jgi:hypothetical protein
VAGFTVTGVAGAIFQCQAITMEMAKPMSWFSAPRPALKYIVQSAMSTMSLTWGGGGDILVAGDYDRRQNRHRGFFVHRGAWYIANSGGSGTLVFGTVGDIPIIIKRIADSRVTFDDVAWLFEQVLRLAGEMARSRHSN